MHSKSYRHTLTHMSFKTLTFSSWNLILIRESSINVFVLIRQLRPCALYCFANRSVCKNKISDPQLSATNIVNVLPSNTVRIFSDDCAHSWFLFWWNFIATNEKQSFLLHHLVYKGWCKKFSIHLSNLIARGSFDYVSYILQKKWPELTDFCFVKRIYIKVIISMP